jgi:hypothetical protein
MGELLPLLPTINNAIHKEATALVTTSESKPALRTKTRQLIARNRKHASAKQTICPSIVYTTITLN